MNSEGGTSALVAVVGAGLVVPGASSPEEFWNLTRQPVPVFREPRRFNARDFYSADPAAEDRTYGRMYGEIIDWSPHPRLESVWARSRSDLQVAWLRHSLLQTLDTVAVAAEAPCAVIVAASTEASHELDIALAADLAADGVARLLDGDPEQHRHRLRRVLAEADSCAQRPHADFLPHAQVLRAVDGLLPGHAQVLVVDNICPAALYAVDLGVKRLLDGEAKVVFCGGVSSHGPLRQVYFAKVGALSRSGDVRAFDADADGTMFSDGAAMVALKRLDDARRDGDDVLGLLVGFGGASDGQGKAIFAPHSQGQVRAIRRAHLVNDLPAEHVAWTIAHGTATITGDQIELHSIASAYPGGTWVTSNKSIVGHTGMACGVVSVVQALSGLAHGTVPVQHRFTAPRAADANSPARIPRRDTAFPEPRPVVGVFACGLGGINGYLLLQHPERPSRGLVSSPPALTDEVGLIGWSAHLPGGPDWEEVRRNLAAGSPLSAEPHFGESYMVPPFERIRVAPGIASQLDRSQLMALSVTADLADRHGRFWKGLEERTAVFGAHYGPTHLACDSALRCFADRIEHALAGTDEDPAGAAFFARHRDTTPPIGAYTLPGRMPCVALGWIANRNNLHGPTMMVDSGLSSGLSALHVAIAYLRRAEVDLALVIGLNTGPAEQHARHHSVDPGQIAEGAFLLVLTRLQLARQRRWPVSALLRATSPPTVWAAPACAPQRPTYLAADAIVDVLRAAEAGTARTITGPYSPAITIVPQTSGQGRPC
ncbi:beta-ketoacyl synthase N-terminal-like domain-containing protein [Nonomuraea sp. NPDC005692]|uniref:beta-ketoacyl synthase N-terminal-like domain-containing protein n=1 Tax=Nonomuraea sp. NPDC005692 TaxID=3157168 RepID=UPI0033F10E72